MQKESYLSRDDGDDDDDDVDDDERSITNSSEGFALAALFLPRDRGEKLESWGPGHAFAGTVSRDILLR